MGDAPLTRGEGDAPLTRGEGASPTLAHGVAAVGAKVPRAANAIDHVGAITARYQRHRGRVLAAGFAYFALLAIVPSALALGAIAGWVGDPAALRDALDRAVERVPALEGATSDVLNALIDLVETTSGAAFGLTTVIGGLLAIYAASRAFVTTSEIIDVSYDREPRERSWLVRIVATLVVLVALVAIVIGVVVLQSLPRLQTAFGVPSTFEGPVASVGLLAVVTLVVLVAFGLGYRFGAPVDVRPPWIGRGAVVATAIVIMGTAFTAAYVRLSASFGAAVAVLGGVLVLMFWLYVVGIALVVGAETEAVSGGAKRRSKRP